VKTALGLTTLSIVLAAVVAYGTHPLWAQFPHGLDVILLSRQLQWPALFLSLVAAISVVALVIAGRQSAWWLIGLAPVLALFGHRFATDPTSGMASVENPTFVPAARASFVADDDYVVGLTFGDKSYAYPYAALYSTPAVVHAQHDKRILVLWSPTANRAVATTIKRDLRARHLDIVSTPANALLVYDTSRGVFINGLTARTIRGEKPPGFLAPVPTAKTTWRQWRASHPETVVMVPTGRLAAKAPRHPLLPSCPMPKGAATPERPTDLPVVVLGTQSPAAVASHELHAAPVNLTADGAPVMAFRDPRTKAVRGFARKVDDLSPRFKLNVDINKAGRGAHLVDLDTDTAWSADGVAVDAKKEFRGKRLAPVVAEDGLYWGVMKFWYPGLELATVEQPDAAVAEAPRAPATAPAKAVTKGKRTPRGERVAQRGAKPRAAGR
jgi:hypothetical protein